MKKYICRVHDFGKLIRDSRKCVILEDLKCASHRPLNKKLMLTITLSRKLLSRNFFPIFQVIVWDAVMLVDSSKM